MTLYLKYRCQTIDELDLEEVRTSLHRILASKDIPHALLFSGPKGTGKTSAARIFAKVINCRNPRSSGEPCNKCEQCVSISKGNNIDVIEIDAASHRGIEDIRLLRDAVKLSPASATKKIYIIDEAHMLTTEASNALLKTLEEPPSHVIFILATTNPEKLLDTIRSRATVVKFRKATDAEIQRQLARIAKGEDIKLKKDVLHAVLRASDGSFRDAAKILEQVISAGIVDDVEAVEKMLSREQSLVGSFLDALAKGDSLGAIEVIRTVELSGGSFVDFEHALLFALHEYILSKTGIGKEEVDIPMDEEQIVKLSKLILEASKFNNTTPLPQLPLEMVVLEWCSKEAGGEASRGQVERAREPEEPQKAKREVARVVRGETPASSRSRFSAKGDKKLAKLDSDSWSKILENAKLRNHSIQALLKAAKPMGIDNNILCLEVYYNFHKERIEANSYRSIIEEIVSETLGLPNVRVKCEISSEKPKKSNRAESIVLTETGQDDIISAAKEIFKEVSNV